MCAQKMASSLYNDLKSVCEVHVKSKVEEFLTYPLMVVAKLKYTKLISNLAFYLNSFEKLTDLSVIMHVNLLP